MRKVIIFRNEHTDEGTFGTLLTDTGFSCRTLELPWRENAPSISCIPKGKYLCKFKKSPTFGLCYHLQNVPGRTAILIHPANFGGDTSKGFHSELKGCISLGRETGHIQNQKALLYSRSTLEFFVHEMNEEDFELTIQGPS